MLKVLINAYSVSPTWGSEPGVGWNWIFEIAKYNKVFVITEGEWQKEIEVAVERLPYKDNIRFYFCPVSEKIRQMCWNQGNYQFYLYYKKWQKRVFSIAKDIIEKEDIDVIHHLNMVTFREPGYLWQLDKPFVWGPISGCAAVNLKFVEGAPLKTRLRYRLKNAVNRWQVRHSVRVRKATKKASCIITPRMEVHQSFKNIYGVDTLMIPETGVKNGCVGLDKIQRNSKGLNLLWCGRFIYTKKLDIALKTIAELVKLRKNVHLHVVGFGMNNEEMFYKQMAAQLGIANNVVWYGKIPNDEVQVMMRKMDALFFTSVVEVTSTVVLEAIQNRLPVICHDTCGFGPLITDNIGRKIELISPDNSVKDFTHIISKFCDDKQGLKDMWKNFDSIVQKLTYEYKGKVMTGIYNQILNEYE